MDAYTELVPAYGRDYNSQKAVKADWDGDKDFQIAISGQYINKSDAHNYAPGTPLLIRYSRLTKVVSVKA